MTVTLDKSALFAAMEAFWEAEGGNDRGVEAAISAYLHRQELAAFNDMATRKRAALAAATARPARSDGPVQPDPPSADHPILAISINLRKC
ncbi:MULTISPECIES: hypothetical protein [unclassified Ensifer]|uniref:hypothetical protein n=1 Tax=unclassified Ensifer TaxID=2633371 RepID=UPI0008134C12|nr:MULTISPECIES: hypothetical protein [unclassified Ensifer]OCP04406.1 hypothetical protein BBX50_25525 [Ensifer sp. LC11]OCP04686.1 hypothetical protein BC374_25545 [Ensifer sp. LC13]OCP13317.1 hypothetical protein BC362_05315 [Ensifer sp. LC14]OCP30510.1 hypothetical protein BC364_25560 [Ensifer sp. LC499]